MKTLTIRYTADINDKSVNRLLDAIEKKINDYEKIVLLISSAGGSISPGITAYNYIKKLPVVVETQNIGSIDSIANVLFCSGKIRTSTPDGTFLFHNVVFKPEKERYDEPELKEQMEVLQDQRRTIASIVSKTCKKPQSVIEELMFKRTNLSAKEAKKLGLIQNISKKSIKPNSMVLHIHE